MPPISFGAESSFTLLTDLARRRGTFTYHSERLGMLRNGVYDLELRVYDGSDTFRQPPFHARFRTQRTNPSTLPFRAPQHSRYA